MLDGGCELSLVAAKSIGEAIIEGTTVEQGRSGKAWVTPVRKHVKEHWEESPTLTDPMIYDCSPVGPIWDTFKLLLDQALTSAIPDDLLDLDRA